MINQSKDGIGLLNSVPYTCYELGHTWDYSCCRTFLGSIKTSFVNALYIYLPFYSVNYLIRFDRNTIYNIKWKTFVTDILRSSCFLSLNGSLAIGGFCLLRQATGKFYGFHAFMVGVIVGYVCYKLEKKGRRKSIAIYTALIATEILYKMAIFRKVVHPIQYGEVILFVCTSAAFMSLYRSYNQLPKTVQQLCHILNGQNSEMPCIKKLNKFWSHICSNNVFGINTIHLLHTKHHSCPHIYSCVYNLVEGCLTSTFMGIGFDIFVGIMHLIQKKQKFQVSTIKFSTFKFLFFYVALLRSCGCLLRWIQNKDSPILNGIISGAVAGTSFIFYRSSTLSLYCFMKLLQVFFSSATYKKYLPSIRNFPHHMYALSFGILMHAAYLEPHNIKASYWKFISNVSGGKFPLMFRKLLDVFGTKASLLNPTYVPNLNKKYVVSAAVKDILKSHGKWK